MAQEDVYDFLEVTANHERFTDHMMVDWQVSGPDRGVGSKVTVKPTSGPPDPIEIEVIEAERPARIVERGVGAKGARETSGTYTLKQLPGGGTEITFELSWKRAPIVERLAHPMVRTMMQRENKRALERLAVLLSERAAG
jgi:hypothetical protein